MRTLKEIMETPLESMDVLNGDELDLYIETIISEAAPGFNYRKINQHVYQFDVKDLLYQVEITESIFPDGKKMIGVKFKLMNNPNAPSRDDFQTDQQYKVAIRKSQIGITGTGNPNAVFAQVMGVMITSIKEIQPNYISFTADEGNRQSLYVRLIKLMEKHIPIKYDRIFINPLTGENTGNEEFWLERKDK